MMSVFKKQFIKQLQKLHMLASPCTIQIDNCRWYSDKESACQCRRCKSHGFNSWVGKILWNRRWQPTPVFLPGKLYGQRSLEGCRAGQECATEHKHMYMHNYVHMNMNVDSGDRIKEEFKMFTFIYFYNEHVLLE